MSLSYSCLCMGFSVLCKIVIMAIYGFVMKLYDDLDELYLISNQRILVCLQTLQTFILAYWLFVVADKKYDFVIIIILFGLSLFDWEAYMDDFYFFSITISSIVISFIMLFIKGCSFTLYELGIFFVFLFLAVPYTEFFCMNPNGFFAEMGKYFHIIPEQPNLSVFALSAVDLEVSFHKLRTRIITVLYLIACFLVIRYLISCTKDVAWRNMLNSLSYLNIFFMFYFGFSIFNQANVLYFHPETLEKHKDKNQ